MGGNSNRVYSGGSIKRLERAFELAWISAGTFGALMRASRKGPGDMYRPKAGCPCNMEEYSRLISSFGRMPSECRVPPDVRFESIFRDGKITHREINTLLDLDFDGRVSSEDFALLSSSYMIQGAQIYAEIESVLNEFGYPIQWAMGMTLSGAAPDYIRKDKGVVLKAVAYNATSFKYAHPELRADTTFVRRVVAVNGYALRYVDPKLRFRKDIVLAAVKTNGHALQFACAGLRADREVVAAAVRQNPQALAYADPMLRQDPELARLARR